MMNENRLKEKQTTQILYRIASVVLIIGTFASLCVLFFSHSKFEEAHQDIFIASAICFIWGLLYVIFPTRFFRVFYKIGVWLASKSIYGIDPVSEKKAYKPSKIVFIIILILSYVLLGVSILINVL